MNRFPIDAKLKRMALCAAVLAVVAVWVTLLCLTLFADLGWGGVGIGMAVSLVLAGLGYALIRSVASSWAAETVKDASELAQAASAMAVGNFSATFNTGIPDEIGQVEGAFAQLLLVQREFFKDIDSFVKRHNAGEAGAINESNYGGDYRNMIMGINGIVSNYRNAETALTTAINALVDGDLSAKNSYGKKSEAELALEGLRKKLETLTRDLQAATSVAEASTRDATVASEQAEKIKQELVQAREETATARREASAANSSATAAKREADTARREADRANSQLKTMTSRTTMPARPMAGLGGALPAPAAGMTPPKTPGTAIISAPAAPKLRSGDHSSVPTIKSVKIVAPSGAHEYDRKDMGKF